MFTKKTLDGAGSYLCIAVISGFDQANKIHWTQEIPSGTAYLGNNDFSEFIDRLRETHLVEWRRYEITPGYFRQNGRWDFDRLDLAYVSISEPDKNPKVIKVARRILRDVRIPIINHPKHTERVTRSYVASALANVPGVLMPKAVRLAKPSPDLALKQVENEAMGFPIILRAVGSHTGKDTQLCDDKSALARALADVKGPQYLTEFCDFRSADGLYRKYRFFKIGRKIVFRHLIVSDNWFIHSSDILRFMINAPELIAEERAVFEEGIDSRFPGATDRIRRITEATKLDYVGIDCSFLDDGRLLVFEVNASMAFFPLRTKNVFGNIDRTCSTAATAALRELLEDKMGRPVVPRTGLSLDTIQSMAASQYMPQ